MTPTRRSGSPRCARWVPAATRAPSPVEASCWAKPKDMDLTEKMAFFEAYGSIAGANGLKTLSAILLQRGLLKMKEPPEPGPAPQWRWADKTPEARDMLRGPPTTRSWSYGTR